MPIGSPPRAFRSLLRPVSSRCAIAAVLLACALAAGGCGGDDSEPANNPPPEARTEQFPKAEGRTLADLRSGLPEGGPVLAPTGLNFTLGENRLGFGLFTASRAQIADAAAAVYVAPTGGGEARGPFLARYESLEVEPQFRSQSSAADPDAAKSVYVTSIPFERAGKYELDRKSTRLNSSHVVTSRMPSSA